MRCALLGLLASVTILTVLPPKAEAAPVDLGALKYDPKDPFAPVALSLVFLAGPTAMPVVLATMADMRPPKEIDSVFPMSAAGVFFGVGTAGALGLGFGMAFMNGDPDYTPMWTALHISAALHWMSAGIGAGRFPGLFPRLPWLGGSIGLTSFGAYRALLSLGGLDNSPGAAIVQATSGAAGALGCFLNAHSSKGTERGVAIGCGAVATLVTAHGIVMAARGDRTPARPRDAWAVAPAPWISGEVRGLLVGGEW